MYQINFRKTKTTVHNHYYIEETEISQSFNDYVTVTVVQYKNYSRNDSCAVPLQCFPCTEIGQGLFILQSSASSTKE